MDDDLAALARCVGDVDQFADRWWGRAPMVRREAGRFDDLLDLRAVDELLTATARRPTFRLVRDGATIPEAEVTTSVRLGGRTLRDVADVARIGALVADGATLVLQGLQRTWPPLTRFCRSLERASSHAVQANAYLTPAGAAGLGRHADGHDVVVLQVHGAKAWDVDGLDALDLAAGDVLYLPAGTGHAAATQGVTSLHLTVGFLATTYRAALGRALDGAGLDGPLPLGFARPERAGALRDGLAAAAAAAAGHLGSVADAVDDLAAAEVERARRRRRPLLSGHLASVLSTIDDATVVRCRGDNPAELVEAEGGAVDLRLVDRTVHLPAQAADAARLLLERRCLAVGDLHGLDAPGRAVLARRLVREGLLEVVPQEPN